jgi:deoxyadenosine/deoxycytidine kinase
MNANEVAKVYDTILSIPGMNETVKLNVHISRRNVLLLNRIIERGLNVKENDKANSLTDVFSKESLQELSAFSEECLKKAGLVDLNEKLKELDNK